jgi:glutaminyl-tRNA synthetase
MAVLDPVRLVLDNVDASSVEICTAPVNPHEADGALRRVPLRRELWIEREDFEETPPPGFIRLTLGGMVRLRFAYVIRCTRVEKDAAGRIAVIHADILPETRSGTPGASSVKVKGAIHWLPVADALPAEVRLFERLFTAADPDAEAADYRSLLTPDSRTVRSAFVEPGLVAVQPEDRYQFERHGYFVADRVDHRPDRRVFNRIATLRDSRGK